MKKLTNLYSHMRTEFNDWKKVKMITSKNGKMMAYNTHLCPRCNHESIIASNYCPECGRHLRRTKSDS